MLLKRTKLVLISTVGFLVLPIASTEGGGTRSLQERTVRPVSATGDLIDIDRLIDERDYTRSNAGTSNYTGLFVTADLGSEETIIGVVQDHGRWSTQYPGRYRIDVSEGQRSRWTRVFEGAGRLGESRAMFEPVRARLVRITATDTRGGGNDWSIAELRIIVDQGRGPRFPDRDRDRDREQDRGRDTDLRPAGDRGMRDAGSAFDRSLSTRATSGTYDYTGASLTIDLGRETEISRVTQLHGEWSDDYPAEYRVEVSRSRSDDRFDEVWRGRGEPGRSVAEFRPVIARYVRITALRSRDRYHWWSIAEIQTGRDQGAGERDDDDQLSGRPIRRVSAQGISNAEAVSDSNNTTRATTGGVNYAGAWIMVELEGNDTVSRVIQIHNPDERDYPGRYRIEVSFDGRRWRTVFQGEGTRGRSAATFSPVRARFIRITAIANHDLQHWWSIYRLRIRG